MKLEEIIEKTNSFLVHEFEVEESLLTLEAPLKETLELDSLDYVDLVVSIENNFGFKMTEEDFMSIVTLSDFYNCVYRKLNEVKEEA